MVSVTIANATNVTDRCDPLFDAHAKWTETEKDLINIVQLVSGSLSFSGSLFIVSCFIAFPSLRKFAFRLVFFLSLSDVFSSISSFFGDPPTCSALCYIQGFTQQWFQVSSVLWTTAIAFTLYMSAVKGKVVDEIEIHEFKIKLFCWGVPLVLATIPFMTSSYENTGGWCWISGRGAGGTVQRMLLFYVPIWVAVGFNCYVYYKVIRIIRLVTRNQVGAADLGKVLSMINRLKLYPLILIVCWIMPTVNRFQNLADPGNPVVWLACTAVGLSSLQGMWNALVYGFTPGVKAALRKALPCCTDPDASVASQSAGGSGGVQMPASVTGEGGP